MSIPASLELLLDPFTRDLGDDAIRKIASFGVDPAFQNRLEDLADRNTEGELSPAELEEYDTLVKALNIVAVIKAKARAATAPPSFG